MYYSMEEWKMTIGIKGVNFLVITLHNNLHYYYSLEFSRVFYNYKIKIVSIFNEILSKKFECS